MSVRPQPWLQFPVAVGLSAGATVWGRILLRRPRWSRVLHVGHPLCPPILKLVFPWWSAEVPSPVYVADAFLAAEPPWVELGVAAISCKGANSGSRPTRRFGGWSRKSGWLVRCQARLRYVVCALTDKNESVLRAPMPRYGAWYVTQGGQTRSTFSVWPEPDGRHVPPASLPRPWSGAVSSALWGQTPTIFWEPWAPRRDLGLPPKNPSATRAEIPGKRNSRNHGAKGCTEPSQCRWAVSWCHFAELQQFVNSNYLSCLAALYGGSLLTRKRRQSVLFRAALSCFCPGLQWRTQQHAPGLRFLSHGARRRDFCDRNRSGGFSRFCKGSRK